MMKNVVILLVMAFVFVQCDAPNDGEVGTDGTKNKTEKVEDSEDQLAIKAVLEAAYINGTQIDGDSAAIRKGFHKSFMMFVSGEAGRVNQVSREDWINGIEEGKIKNPNKVKPAVTFKVPMVDVTGSAGIAKVEVSKDGKHVFTDYMSLYKKDGNWKLVGKIYERH
jgi:hypothetical protein